MGRRKKNQTAVEQLPSEATKDQDAPGGLKSEIPQDNGDTAKCVEDQAETDTAQFQETEKDFETQRESIEGLDPKEIQPFDTIPDYLEPTSSLYPIVVKTPTSITCIEGWPRVLLAKEAAYSTITCHIYHVADASQEELAIRKVASRTKPQGGIASYAEKARNVSKAFRMLKESNENPVLFLHGGDRRGIIFTSLREENIRIVLARRFGKSPATIGKYINHGDYISEDAMQILAQAEADKEYFEAFQEAKMKLVEHMRGQQLSQDEIVSRVSDEILRLHGVQKKDRPREIKNLLVGLAPAQPPQDNNTAEPVEPGPVATLTRVEEAEKVGEGKSTLEEAAEEVRAGEEEKGECIPNPEEEFQTPISYNDLHDDQTFSDEEIRNRGMVICEELRRSFANREIPLPETKQRMRSLIGDLNQILAEVPEA